MRKIGEDYSEETLKAAHYFARSVLDSECNPNDMKKHRVALSDFYDFQAVYKRQYDKTPNIETMNYWRNYHSSEDDIPW